MVKLVVTDKDGQETTVEARVGWSLMENIRDLPRSVEAICGGMCACATCHVFIDAPWRDALPPRRLEEKVMLENEPGYDPARSRLSCQIAVTEALDGLRLTVCPDDL